MNHRHFCRLACVIVSLCLMGCHADPARDRSTQAVDRLLESRTSMIAGEKMVEASVGSLRTLKNAQADLRPAFTAFRQHIPILLNESDRVRVESEALRAQCELHVQAWQSDLGTINNQQLRQAGEDRAQQVRDRYTQIEQLYATVNAGYLKYIAECKDLETYLANDLNYPALLTAKQWVSATETSGEHLRQSIADLASELSNTTNVLSPVPVPQRMEK